MDEKTLLDYATKACRKFTDDLNGSAAQIDYGIDVEPSETKVRGISHKPFSNKWEINFNEKSPNYVSSWVVKYKPTTNASEEEHIEAILRLMWEHQAFR